MEVPLFPQTRGVRRWMCGRRPVFRQVPRRGRTRRDVAPAAGGRPGTRRPPQTPPADPARRPRRGPPPSEVQPKAVRRPVAGRGGERLRVAHPQAVGHRERPGVAGVHHRHHLADAGRPYDVQGPLGGRRGTPSPRGRRRPGASAVRPRRWESAVRRRGGNGRARTSGDNPSVSDRHGPHRLPVRSAGRHPDIHATSGTDHPPQVPAPPRISTAAAGYPHRPDLRRPGDPDIDFRETPP